MSHVTQATRHRLNSGDWAQLKTPIDTLGAEHANAARERGAARAQAIQALRRGAFAPQNYNVVGASNTQLADWMAHNVTIRFALLFGSATNHEAAIFVSC